MKLMSVLSGNGFVMFNKELAHEVSVNASIIFGQLCSSYESFGSKNMLTVRERKEYFFLTSETLEKETALTYKQQLKAAKELESFGYIETRVMGVPSKKYFHITDKIRQELLGNPRTAKREDLNISTNQEGRDIKEISSYSKREYLGDPKGNGKPVQKGSTIKKKNKKEQNNNINFNCNFKNSLESDKFREALTEACNEFFAKFAIGRWSKDQWSTLINKFVEDTIVSKRYLDIPEEKIKGYAYKSLKTIADNSDYKHSEEFAEYQETMMELAAKNPAINEFSEVFYNWLVERE